METKRLILDAIKETDKEDYFHNISHDKKVLETFICRYAETLEEFDFSSYPGREDLFAIRLKENGRLIGIILYFDAEGDRCEIGYGIGSDHWGRGYATEAVRRFLRFCFEEKGFQTVTASFFPGNNASRRVMEKCGMTFCRVSEKELTYLGVERDLIYYSVQKDDVKEKELREDLDAPQERGRGRVVLITGATHTGKTVLANRLLKRFGIPAFSIDHLKMGLIRSGQTELTPEDDDKLTEYLWPIVREIVRTVIENEQSLILEGCYIPPDWRRSFGAEELRSIRFVCLSMTNAYIDAHFPEIAAHASDAEKRPAEDFLTPAFLKEENRRVREAFSRCGESVTLIDDAYERALDPAVLFPEP